MRFLFIIAFFLFSKLGLSNFESDTAIINTELEKAAEIIKTDSVESHILIKRSLKSSQRIGYKLGEGNSLKLIGSYYAIWHKDLDKTIEYYSNAVKVYSEIGEKEKAVDLTIGLSYTCEQNGNIDLAFTVLTEGLKDYKDEPAYGCILNNRIAGLMKSNGEWNKAIYYFDISDDYFQEIEEPTRRVINTQLSNDKNRGVCYRNNESYDTAMYYFNRSLNRSIEIQDTGWIARNQNSIGILHFNLKEYEEALAAFNSSLALKRSMNYVDGSVNTLTNITNIYIELEDYEMAKKKIDEAFEESKLGFVSIEKQSNLYEIRGKVYGQLRIYDVAYKSISQYIVISDSIDQVERAEAANEIEAKYQSESNKILQAKLEAELETADVIRQQKEKELERQYILFIIGTVIGLVMLVMLVYAVRSNKKRKAANKELISKNTEITKQSNEITAQKHQIEEKNQEILDSINYAKRIQDAILPSAELTKKLLPKNFIYYQPKDIVSGDFYWVDETDSHIFWAAADCTGHGVPGAMVSVICHGALNRSVHEFNLVDPGKILNKTRELVIQTFAQSGQNVKDGMDISMCVKEKSSGKVFFAGANNPVWIIRQGQPDNDKATELNGFWLDEVKGNKQPVGVHYDQKDFTSKELTLNQGEIIYLFTDGFADQFGGEKGKKLKYKNLKKIFLELATTNLPDQELELKTIFDNWKGGFEQLDDVCVIGVRV